MSLAVSDLAPQPAFQKGPGWPRKVHVSRVSFRTRFFFRKKKQAKRSDGLCVHHLFRCSCKDTSRHVWCRCRWWNSWRPDLHCKRCARCWGKYLSPKQWSFNPELPIWGNFEGFPLFFGAIFGLAWPYESTIDRTYRLFDRFISLHSFEAWHWGIIQLHQFFVWLTSVGVPFFWDMIMTDCIVSHLPENYLELGTCKKKRVYTKIEIWAW